MTIRLGVFGGTFDPIHIGHLIIAQEACERLSLDRVLFVPARVSPLKGDGTLFTAEQRTEMVRAAIAADPRFVVSTIDLERPAPSYTVDTLRLLQEEWGPDTQLYFILGVDSLLTFGYWYRPDEIIRLARLAVISRPGYEPDLIGLDQVLPGLAAATDLVESVHIGISSTELRRRLQEGASVRYFVNEPVWALLQRYQEGQA
ncbi:MAG: nicotinate (nicotinamide) nucleotide adenylyltransferase [Chloroflexi bacterium]|nr:nicotinate (nicotinamide) nucleotide adenylyltransferase [Chloroflexota bacterium]